MRDISGRQLELMFRSSIREIEREGVDKRIRTIAQKLSPEQRIEAMGMAMSISSADGEIEPEEMAILRKAQTIFGLSDQQVDDALARYR